MLIIYGTKKSSAYRCHWLLAELGITDYETRTVDIAGGANKLPEFLKLNPNGKVPVMVDEDFVLFESFAINQYLAAKHQPELLGESLPERALVNQWQAWALANLADPFMTLILQFYRKTPDDADIAAARAAIARFLPILDQHLADKDYLVGNKFTLADLNVSSLVAEREMTQLDFSPYPHLQSWLTRLNERPAVKSLA